MDVKDDILFNIEDLAVVGGKQKRSSIKKIERGLKRSIDILGGICGTLLLIPLTVIIWIAHKLSKDNGPIFYTQTRIGKNGKLFKMYKYRSMVVGADEILKRYLEENEEARKEYKKYKKLKCDPRITKVGKVLRATSLDEFPQLINVLKGDMSLVGPRPLLVEYIKLYSKEQFRRHEVRPGITGWAQVNGRNTLRWAEKFKLDIYYVDNFNIFFDIKILFMTLIKVIKREGISQEGSVTMEKFNGNN